MNDDLCVDRDCDWFERLGVAAGALASNLLNPVSGRYQTLSRSEPRSCTFHRAKADNPVP